MPGPFTVKYDDFSGGWAGDVDRARAKKGQWFGQDVMLYTDGLVGPRHPLRTVNLTSPPSSAASGIEALQFEHPGGTPKNGIVVFLDETAGNAKAYIIGNYADFSGAGVAIDQTVAIGSVAGAVAGDSSDSRLYFTRNSLTTFMSRLQPGGANSDVTLGYGSPTQPSPLEVLVHWNDRMLYAVADKLVYSDANTGSGFTSWPATNVLQIGDGGLITCLIPSPLALYVGKTSGWWIVTGVLGVDAQVRQVWERDGLEFAQTVDSVPSFVRGGVRLAARWEHGMLWLRRRANDAETDLGTSSFTPTSAVENTEVMSFTGAHMEQIGVVRLSRLARVGTLQRGAAIVDFQHAPVAPLLAGTQHVVLFVDPDGRMSRHVIDTGVLPVLAPLTPVHPSEGANSPQVGYAADHLWLVSLDSGNGPLRLNALRYRASRPGYGTDLDQADQSGGAGGNVVGVLELPDYWSPDGRQVKVKAVYVACRVYDNSAAGNHFVSTARLRAKVTTLGRIDLPIASQTADSQISFGLNEVVAAGTGDRDIVARCECNSGGYGLGFRVHLELEQVAVREVWVVCESGEVIA